MKNKAILEENSKVNHTEEAKINDYRLLRQWIRENKPVKLVPVDADLIERKIIHLN